MNKLIFILIVIFFIYNFALLNKYPLVTPDETWFANYAYSLTGKETLSSTPFEHRLPIIDKYSQIAYGPIYPLILSIPLRFLPYGLTTTRLTSIFLGALTVLVAFLLTKSLLKSTVLAFLTAFFLSIDFSFLLRARFVRPEISAILFTYLSYLLYQKKRYLLTGFLISLSIFSHYFIGIIPLVTIIPHYLLNQKSLKTKNFLFLILPTIIFSFIWLLYLNPAGPGGGFNSAWQSTVLKRTAPNFQLITSFTGWDAPQKALFVIYLLSFFSLLISKTKSNTKTLCLINFVVTFAVFSFGNSVVYDGILTLPAVLCLAAAAGKFLFPMLLAALTLTNIYGQALVLIVNADFSYTSFGQAVSANIEHRSKVFIKYTNPDPYLYLAQNRTDLKLDYYQMFNKDNYPKSLSEADYIITHGYDLVFLENYKKSHALLPYPFDLELTKLLEKNGDKINVVANIKTVFPYNTVVIKTQK